MTEKESLPPARPSRKDIALLEMFADLGLRDIELVAKAQDAARALAALEQHCVVGFDTESKPSFVKNDAQAGPHTVQCAMDRAWLFQLHDADCRPAAASLLASSALTKIQQNSGGVLPEQARRGC